MLIPPKYVLTNEIATYLQTIEANNQVINTVIVPPEVELNIRRQSILKSSLFSARIEGNPLTLDEITTRPSKDQKKQEIYNILKAMQLVRNRGKRDISQAILLSLHQTTMKGLIDRPLLGRYRTEVSAIFNTAGIAIYLPPPPKQILGLMTKLLTFTNSQKEQFIPIRACLAHYSFEKIHPFLDGNGRVGRLLFHAVLEKNDYGMKGLLSIEEYLDNHRSEYYNALQDTERDVTGYITFMLGALADSSLKAKELVLQKEDARPEDYMLPRRSEILAIIKDHKIINFDMLRRRFMAVNPRTLRFDLKKLQDANLIRKRGTTKGVFYEPI